MNIRVQVLSAQAQAQIKALQAQVAGLQGQLAKTSATSAGAFGGPASLAGLRRWGNQLQWSGRMLQYNFTVPLLLAAGAGTKFALDQEKAMTRVAKVYGDTAGAIQFYVDKGLSRANASTKVLHETTGVFAKELDALEKSFIAMSERYGVAASEVMEVAGAWAAAGASGEDLARSVDLTMKAMILGELESAEATEALIAIQSQYNLSSTEMVKTLAQLNAIENQTGIQTAGLIQGFSRSAAVAREAGIDTRYLGAMLAALVPATGSAAQAGNALKTIISRVLSPTQEAAQVIKEMGFNIESTAWQSATAAERIQMLSDKWETMNGAAKAVASSVIASRWQITKFEQLMEELSREHGYYNKALDATASRQQIFTTMNRELNKVLESSPARLEQIWRAIQNGMATAVQPMIPYLIWLAQSVADGVKAFQELPPEVQKLVLILALATIALGPIIRYLGALGTALWAVSAVFSGVGSRVLGAGKLLGSGLSTIFTSLLGYVWTFVRGFGIALSFLPKAMMMFSAATYSAAKTLVAIPIISVMIGKSLVAIWTVTLATIKGLMVTGYAAMKAIAVAFWIGDLTLAAAWRAAVVIIHASLWKSILLLAATSAKSLLFIFGATRAGFVAFFVGLKALILRFGAVLVSWPAALVVAIVSVLYALRGQVSQVWGGFVSWFASSTEGAVKYVLQAWNMLPQGVANALIAVARVVQTIALQIYEWMSYLNPFAKHSPSLVDNVKAGLAAVKSEFSTLKSVRSNVAGVYPAIEAFGRAIAGLGVRAAAFQRAQDRIDLKKFVPGALGEWDKLSRHLARLEPTLSRLQSRLDSQQRVVDRWQNSVDAANRKLQAQQNILDDLQKVADSWQSKLDEAQTRLDSFANAPLKGMREMEDAIYANERAQSALRSEMMDFEAVSGTYDEIKSKLDAINGAQEFLRGTQENLRLAGAGSEVLSRYDQEIAALGQQKTQYEDNIRTLEDMRGALEELQREAERLDLTKSMKFDDLRRQIEQAASVMQEEMSFDDIIAGVRDAKNDVVLYEGKLRDANKAVADQQAIVDRLTSRRDVLQNSLDTENAKLETIRDRYDQINGVVQDINDAMSISVQNAQSLDSALKNAGSATNGIGSPGGRGSGGGGLGSSSTEEYVSPGLQNFRDATKYGGEFPDTGGAGALIRKNWESELSGINDITQGLAKETAGMFAGLNPFGPIKRYWNQFQGWAQPKWSAFKTWSIKTFGQVWDGLTGDKAQKIYRTAQDTLKPFLDLVISVVRTVIKWGGKLWDLFGPEVKKTLDALGKGFIKLWKKLSPIVASFGDLLGPLGEALQNLWVIVQPILAFIVIKFIALAKVIWSTVNGIIGPAFDFVIDIISNALKIVRGILKVFIGVFTADWDMFWSGIKDILGGVVGGIISAVVNLVKIVWGALKGFVTGVVGFFKWLYNILVGNSIVPDMIQGIIDAFFKLIVVAKWVWNNVLKPLYQKFVQIWRDYIKPALKAWWGGIKAVWTVLFKLAQWLWQNVLKPIWNVVQDLWTRVRGSLKTWWEGIKAVWNILKTLGGWVWSNVLQPVLSRVKALWTDHVRPSLKGWWEGIKNVWNSLKTLGQWVWNNVMKPVVDKIKEGWNSIKDWLTKNKGMLTNPVQGVVNVVIKAVNAMIRGLNKIADILPGLDWSISLIPELAAGGIPLARRVGGGFKTNGARAIVGEGKANHPEFVIPTDPTHRRRAQTLIAAASARLGMVAVPAINRRGAWGDTPEDMRSILASQPGVMNGLPAYGLGGIIGGFIGTAKNMAKAGAGWIKGNLATLVSAPFKAFANTARGYMDKVGWTYAQQLGNWSIDRVMGWVTAADKVYESRAKGVQNQMGGGPGIQRAKAWASTQGGKPYIWGGVGPAGYDCSGFMSAIANVALGRPPYSRLGATATFPWPGFVSGVASNGFTIGSTKSYAGGIGHMAGTIDGLNVESAGGIGSRVGASARGYGDPGFTTIARLTGLANGGIIRRTAGGVAALLGEGTRDEAVTPLPKNWRTQGLTATTKSGNVYNISIAKVEFPNITSSDDAEKFIENLEILTKD